MIWCEVGLSATAPRLLPVSRYVAPELQHAPITSGEVLVRQETIVVSAVRGAPALRMLAVLMGLACGGGPAAPSLDDDPDDRSFVGNYELRAVDGVPLPTAVRVMFAGDTMQVESGVLTFGPEREIAVKATGQLSLTSVADTVSLGTGGVYVRFGADSLMTTTGLEGRVWGDSAEIRTASWTVVGGHVWRYAREPGS